MSNYKIDETWSILEGEALTTSGPSYGEYGIVLGRSERIFSVAHFGDWMEPERLSKYKTVYFKQTIDSEIYNHFYRAIQELKVAEWGDDSIKKAKALTAFWEETFLVKKHPEFWSYLLALYEELYPKEISELGRIHELAIPIYERSFHLAGLAFYHALKNGIYDLETLREIFLVSLFIDCGLAHPSFHYNLYTALERDRTRSENGADFLKRLGHGEEEVKFYLNHAYVSFVLCKETLANHVKNERLLDLIKIHHETGPYAFPKSLTQFECDDIELIIILINQALPYVELSKVSILEVISDIGTLSEELRNVGR